MIKIGMEELTEKDNTNLTIILNCINDFERMSDHALNIAESAKDMHRDSLFFSQQAQDELKVYSDALQEIVRMSVAAFTSRDRTTAIKVEPLEEVIDHLHEALKLRHIERLRNGECSIDLGMVLTDITTSMERIADHCSNIAVAIIEIQQGVFDPHNYIKKLKKKNNVEFQKMYEDYFHQYSLPGEGHGFVTEGVSTKELVESTADIAART